MPPQDSPDNPAIMPLDPAPLAAADCARCELRGGTSPVWGEGNPAAPLYIILDNPGAREDPSGRPFLCPTRRTLLAAMADAGLSRDSVYVTYILKCRPRRAYIRGQAWGACLPWLERQILEGRPRILALLGNNVLRAVTGDSEAEVKAARKTRPTFFGRPAVVSYHPLAAWRRPNLMPLLIEDLRAAAELLPS